MKKVGIFITRLDKGGSSDFVLELFKKVSGEEFEKFLIYGKTKDPGEKLFRLDKDARENLISVPFLRRKINPFWDLAALFSLAKIIRRYRFDIIHVNTSKVSFLIMLLAPFLRAKIIYSPHGHIFYGYFSSFLSKLPVLYLRLFASFIDRIVTLTEEGKKEFIRRRIAKAEKITVIPCGINLSEFSKRSRGINWRKELQIQDNERVIGTIARLEPIKGVGDFIRAAAEVKKKRPNAKFVIVGEGSQKDYLSYLAKNLGIEKDILFLGKQENTYDFYKMFDVFVLSSLNEGLGRVILEAFFAECAVVASAVGGVPDLVRDGQSGLLYPAHNFSKLADKIIALLDNERLRLKLIEGAKGVFARFPAEEEAIAQTISLYRQIVK